MMYMIVEPMISWSEQSKTCIESNRKHRVQQQDHSRIRLMVVRAEDSEDEAVEEASAEQKALAVEKALVVVADQLLATTMEL